MKLCFGTYAKVLTLFLEKGISRKKLLHTLVHSVDPDCTLPDNAVSRLLSCRSNLPNGRANGLGQVISKAMEAVPKEVAHYFAENLPKLLIHKDLQLIVLTLCDMILKDDSIDGDTVVDIVGSLNKNALKKQDKFVLSDFLAGIFLFVVSVDNNCGKEESDLITHEHVDSFADRKDSVTLMQNRNANDADSVGDLFYNYMNAANDKYATIKTLLYKNEPKPFYSFYVPNSIVQPTNAAQHIGHSSCQAAPHSATVKSLTEISNFIIIEGIGGLGKSMMLRHLLLDTIKKYDSFRHIPLFVSLKDYNGQPLVEYICSRFKVFDSSINNDIVKSALSYGLCVLLLDGLDEMNSTCCQDFEREIENLVDTYPHNCYVISSRPYQLFSAFERFTVLTIEPFTKRQSVELIERIEFREDEPNIKAKFLKLIQGGHYDTHRSFIENPLLLTILLMTFERYAEIPTKMHIFYREAYVTLYQTHDASKGGYRRSFKSSLDVDEFSEYFAEFCFLSYRVAKTNFTEMEFSDFFAKLHVNDGSVRPGDFAFDLYNNLCLLIKDGAKYHFTHRSFQEYFCALFFSKQSERVIGRLGAFFEKNKNRMRSDSTFGMLYDMARSKVEAHILIPFLKELFKECDNENGYWTYLVKMYPNITYEIGDVNNYSVIRPQSYLYDFVSSLLKVSWKKHFKDLPCDSRFCVASYAYVTHDENLRELVRVDNKQQFYQEYHWLTEIPAIAGWRYQLKTSEVCNDFRFREIASVLNDDTFVLKMEYNLARKFLDDLIQKHQREEDYLDGLF